MEASIGVSEGYVEDRLRFLGYAGFVDRFHAEMCEITSWGHLYLDGSRMPITSRRRAWTGF